MKTNWTEQENFKVSASKSAHFWFPLSLDDLDFHYKVGSWSRCNTLAEVRERLYFPLSWGEQDKKTKEWSSHSSNGPHRITIQFPEEGIQDENGLFLICLDVDDTIDLLPGLENIPSELSSGGRGRHYFALCREPIASADYLYEGHKIEVKWSKKQITTTTIWDTHDLEGLDLPEFVFNPSQWVKTSQPSNGKSVKGSGINTSDDPISDYIDFDYTLTEEDLEAFKESGLPEEYLLTWQRLLSVDVTNRHQWLLVLFMMLDLAYKTDMEDECYTLFDYLSYKYERQYDEDNNLRQWNYEYKRFNPLDDNRITVGTLHYLFQQHKEEQLEPIVKPKDKLTYEEFFVADEFKINYNVMKTLLAIDLKQEEGVKTLASVLRSEIKGLSKAKAKKLFMQLTGKTEEETKIFWMIPPSTDYKTLYFYIQKEAA